MSEPELELYCGACKSRLHVDRIPIRRAGGTPVQWLNGRIRCLTPGCLCDQGALDRDGNPVQV